MIANFNIFTFLAFIAYSFIIITTAEPFFNVKSNHLFHNKKSCNINRAQDIYYQLNVLDCLVKHDSNYLTNYDLLYFNKDQNIAGYFLESDKEILILFKSLNHAEIQKNINTHLNESVPLNSNYNADNALITFDLKLILKDFYQIINKVSTYISDSKIIGNKNITIAGLDYGGSVAEVIAYQFIYGEHIQISELWTFDSFRAGNSKFAFNLCKKIEVGCAFKNIHETKNKALESRRWEFSESLQIVEIDFSDYFNTKQYCN